MIKTLIETKDCMRIKELLKSKGMTAKELAGKLGISEGALSQSIKEGANPNLQTLMKIASALEVSVSELFDAPKDGVIRCPNCGSEIKLNPEL